MFTHTYESRYGDYKDFDTIKPGAVLDMIQDISIKDSMNSGYGLEKLREQDMAWLIKGINVKFENKVKTNLPIEVFTAVKSMKGATSERGCIVKQNGEIVAKSIATWFLFDTKNYKIARIPPEMQSVYELYDFNDDFFTYQNPQIIKMDDASYSVRVANKEIDTNKHLNNQRGADLLMDVLPFDFYFNSMKVVYKKQATLGDELEVCISEIENGYYVHLQTAKKEICVAGEFTNI